MKDPRRILLIPSRFTTNSSDYNRAIWQRASARSPALFLHAVGPGPARHLLHDEQPSICRLLSVEDLSLEVDGLDAINGTPVLDIKPYMREFAARGEIRQPRWVDELMRGYWENTYFG